MCHNYKSKSAPEPKHSCSVLTMKRQIDIDGYMSEHIVTLVFHLYTFAHFRVSLLVSVKPGASAVPLACLAAQSHHHSPSIDVKKQLLIKSRQIFF